MAGRAGRGVAAVAPSALRALPPRPRGRIAAERVQRAAAGGGLSGDRRAGWAVRARDVRRALTPCLASAAARVGDRRGRGVGVVRGGVRRGDDPAGVVGGGVRRGARGGDAGRRGAPRRERGQRPRRSGHVRERTPVRRPSAGAAVGVAGRAAGARVGRAARRMGARGGVAAGRRRPPLPRGGARAGARGVVRGARHRHARGAVRGDRVGGGCARVIDDGRPTRAADAAISA